ncbi:BlaI/MecI/CopY family transcriptional regulator [Nonomuraea gerenzanensis]|uniref:Transcriptional regulator, MecI family n=1 Tax=Nonomuraea gerenzanensis TaxID=93944 RepID=A0A1M4EEN5_9ACTN|nr:BlaI/MecI/CopY family transcriptional regulator [Nonomuraea gerenzanensis]UBU08812.1 BlaI/MecI/CopY family transcriptional regulator [Nonomuraea gerenzanensis]SBO97176.1 Transcriptional regulator, MecI family [Nonomuraea gerenzanensis]
MDTDPEDRADQGERRRPGELEAAILAALRDAGCSLTSGQVRDLIDPTGGLSYSAVVTTLVRLHKKRAVTRRREGRAYRYGALTDAAGLVAQRMNALLSAEDDRAMVLRRFVRELEPGDEELLRRLLADEPDPPGGTGT